MHKALNLNGKFCNGGANVGWTSVLVQGPLKIWTEHSTQSLFLKFALRCQTYGGPQDPLGVLFGP